MCSLLAYCPSVLSPFIGSNPAWAKDLIDNLPTQQPKPSELLKLFQEHLDSGDIKINHLLGRVACPECNASVKEFEERVVGEDAHTIVVFTCPECGWSEHVEV